MQPNVLKGISIASFVICAICLFVAYERYETNASTVLAMNQFLGSAPAQMLLGNSTMTPAVPTATKYALALAALSGAGGLAAWPRLRQAVEGLQPKPRPAAEAAPAGPGK